jgi:Arc/MetJ family transcription regulator
MPGRPRKPPRRRRKEERAVFTSLDIDEELFMKAWRLSSLKTKKAFFEEMLRMYARLHEQAGVQSLRGKLVWDGDLSKVRETRDAGTR